MPQDWFMWLIVFWCFVMVFLFAIGGYFMFRKFLKKLPKNDGKSDMDWEEHFVNETIELWHEEQKAFLEDLVTPVPELFRDVARHKIAGKIGEIALNEQAATINEDLIIRGYILATPKRDHKFLRKKMKERKIDLTKYEQFFI
ncbi:DUF2621 domain-containing protein [Bacillus sp. 1NLA3E]|uniref:DUF2621 domain-containing protein n=1 Tax=Bacillus sp. 1NLA3E TaxID=666686 RepID=UPI000247EAF0|nr:DUF2621 domain-containing protein [Bacillus sp. 1NLA3E]AGK53167.1 hypothetical protein B1NLA3E_07015 [Bacillus sp. 1NLA3E]